MSVDFPALTLGLRTKHLNYPSLVFLICDMMILTSALLVSQSLCEGLAKGTYENKATVSRNPSLLHAVFC